MIELNEQIIFLGDGTEGDLEYKLYEYMIWLGLNPKNMTSPMKVSGFLSAPGSGNMANPILK